MFPGSLLVARSATGEDAQQKQQHERADKRHEDAPEMKAGRFRVAKGPHDSAANEGTHDTHDQVAEEALGAVIWYDAPRQEAGDNTDNDPGQDTHCLFLLQPGGTRLQTESIINCACPGQTPEVHGLSVLLA
jgi:hypothetical protein